MKRAFSRCAAITCLLIAVLPFCALARAVSLDGPGEDTPISLDKKQSYAEGKVVDWNGSPVPGVKVIATQQGQPIKGYQRVVTVTNSDGSFKLSGLYPSSGYDLELWSDKWEADAGSHVSTPDVGETALVGTIKIYKAYSRPDKKELADLFTLETLESRANKREARANKKYSVSSDGMITDSTTGLKWLPGPDQDTNYNQAAYWVATRPVLSGRWRMPTITELKTLYDESFKCNISPLFKFSNKFGWISPYVYAKTAGKSSYLMFMNGNEITPVFTNLGSSGSRVIAVYDQKIRYSRSSDGVITDSETNLQWLPGTDQRMNYREAQQWVVAQTVAGGGWRMPMENELQDLCLGSLLTHISLPSFGAGTEKLYVWRKDPLGSGVEIRACGTLSTYIGDSLWVFAVRPARPTGGTGAAKDVANQKARYSRSADGVITDSETNLQWLPGPDQKIKYEQAERWISAQTVAGGGWKMPRGEQLLTLYDDSFKGHIFPLLDAAIHAYPIFWSDSTGLSEACYVAFEQGKEGCSSSNPNRVLAVRVVHSTVDGKNAGNQKVRYSRSADGVITDSETNLQWLPGLDQKIQFDQAERWIVAQTVAGGGWRMPTRAELKTLYDESLQHNISPLFGATDYRWVWAGARDSSSAWSFFFYNGNELSFERSYYNDRSRVFAVRPLLPAATATATGQPAPTLPVAAPIAYPPLTATAGKSKAAANFLGLDKGEVKLAIQVLAPGKTMEAVRIDNIGGTSALWRSDGKDGAVPLVVSRDGASLSSGAQTMNTTLGDTEALLSLSLKDNGAFAGKATEFRVTVFFSGHERTMCLLTVK